MWEEKGREGGKEKERIRKGKVTREEREREREKERLTQKKSKMYSIVLQMRLPTHTCILNSCNFKPHCAYHVFRMTKFDIRNYFEKIYGIRVAKVNTRIQLGKMIIGASRSEPLWSKWQHQFIHVCIMRIYIIVWTDCSGPWVAPHYAHTYMMLHALIHYWRLPAMHIGP